MLQFYSPWLLIHSVPVFQETVVDDLIDGDTPDLAAPLESQYPHVKRSLQQGEACLLQWSNLSVEDGTVSVIAG